MANVLCVPVSAGTEKSTTIAATKITTTKKNNAIKKKQKELIRSVLFVCHEKFSRSSPKNFTKTEKEDLTIIYQSNNISYHSII